MVTPRSVMRASSALSAPAASASTPSNGSSRKRILGPWMTAAAGALKALLGRMTDRGVTIFLTSHVLEIVERLCSHVAIIKKGQLVAQGSIEQLRAGVPGAEGRTSTLEDIFLSVVGGGVSQPQIEELSWLT